MTSENKNPVPALPEARVHYATLGRTAVRSDNILTVWDINGFSPVGKSTVDGFLGVQRPEYELGRTRGIAQVRKRLSGLSEDQNKTLNAHLNRTITPHFRTLKEAAPDQDWSAWLAAEDAQGEATNERRLVNFLQWHIHSLEQQQTDPEVLTAIHEQKTEFKQALIKGRQEGWINPNTAAMTADKVDGVHVYIGDIFDTLLNENSEEYGHHTPGSNEIVITGALDNTADIIADVAKHELNHAVFAGFDQTWIDEAITEHLAQVMDHGDVETVNPIHRKQGDNSVYVAERMLLDTLLSHGAFKIDPKLLLRAYSHDPSQGENTEMAEFRRQLAEAWDVPLPLELIGAHMLQVEEGLLEDSDNEHKVRAVTLAAVHTALSLEPEAIFGAGYVKPQRREATSS